MRHKFKLCGEKTHGGRVRTRYNLQDKERGNYILLLQKRQKLVIVLSWAIVKSECDHAWLDAFFNAGSGVACSLGRYNRGQDEKRA